MMTLEQAYTMLRNRWPDESFAIKFEVWHHDGRSENPTVEWAIWDNGSEHHLFGPTLENVIEQALGTGHYGLPSLASVDRQIVWTKDRSGYEIVGPLTQEKS